MEREVIRALAVIAIIAVAPAAGADPRAEKLADKGFAAYDEGEYATAIDYFERANTIAPTPGLLFNIAQAYRKLGKPGCEPALDYYQRYRQALADSGAPVDEGLRARIVEMKACAAGAEPVVDDGDEGDRGDGGEEVEAPVIRVATPPSSGRRKLGWLLVGGGGVATAVAAITGILALDRESDLSAMCENDVCAPSLEGDVTGYNRLRYTALASATIGAAALIGGAYLLWTERPAETGDALQARVQPVIGRDAIGVRCAF